MDTPQNLAFYAFHGDIKQVLPSDERTDSIKHQMSVSGEGITAGIVVPAPPAYATDGSGKTFRSLMMKTREQSLNVCAKKMKGSSH